MLLRPATARTWVSAHRSDPRSLFLCLVLVLFLVSGGAVQASTGTDPFAEKRLALVVGIAGYDNAPDLANTTNDGKLISDTLNALNFRVSEHFDIGLEEFRNLLKQFAFDAETADVALVYFAGHGIEVGGRNFLVPADAKAGSRQQVADTSVSLDDILAAVDKARQLRIVILDSCRNDPFADDGARETLTVDSRTAGRGLAPASPERGTLVAYAAEAGAVALDGAGDNSPFAMALAQTLRTRDLEIGLAFRQVRDTVLKATANAQEPHTYGSLSGKPYFLAGSSQEVNGLAATARRNAWGRLEVDQEEQLQVAAREGDSRALKGLAYMRLNPDEDRYDPAKAAAFLEKAADAGDPEAMFELARMYERGIGVDQDVDKALDLFRKSAAEGFADAINDLGFLHFQGGLGIVRDPKKAIELFGQAADQRHPEAMFNYAALIDDGVVDGKSADDAAEYLYRALRSGNEEVLGQLSENPKMFKAETRRSLQRKLAERAFYSGSIDGQFGPQTQRGLRKAYGLSE
ncbi:caspase family protein [Roseibium sediminicola]|uniref:Caspase family protein n=1 Tax=Roseibium sediminicola TaxID=2933272 RepID=A0ABT0H2F4_9HYPH|nr:caspase family protein [Roseibium sp. CAU 1639]MCK7615854.1 caspase family protein [Roseibium sp. CAU 1639]